ncbi:MAG: Stk1 family PASTA domain-containing Ser/Thr kinase [Microbacteriaceae bacterium]
MTEGVTRTVSLLAGRYQVADLIGRGGMADVYAGTDSRLGRRVAIKLLKPELATDPSFRSRFRREAQEAAKMAHPTIVRIFDAGEETVVDREGHETQLPFIIMEYVDGRLLKDIVAQGPLAPAEATRIIDQVLTALEYSHRAGVIHRDIKPGNIMVTATGQVKVMDFGIARAISETSANLAETSSIVGTASYFSPEQARGETVDPRTDLYSAGIVLFELLTGRAPFSGDNPVAVAYQHVNQLPPAPSSLNPHVSAALDAVTLRAVAKDRFERYQSAAEFRKDIESSAQGILAVRPNSSNSDFNATLFGVNPTTTAGSEATLRQLTAHESDKVVRTQNRPPVAWIWGGVVLMVVIVVAVGYWALNLTPQSLTSNVAIEVPDVVGFSWEDGSTAITEAKLQPSRFEESSDSVQPGAIVRTDPSSGITVSPGQLIKVYVSSGAVKTPVPQLVNMTQAAAQAALESVGLTLGSVSSNYSSTIPADTVLSTLPANGELVTTGTAIDIVISNGLVQIPDQVGKTVGEATSTLSSLQLQIRTTGDTGCSGGNVTSQSLTGDAPQKSAITITYCAAP